MEKTHRLRVLIAAFLSLLVFAGIEARLYTIQITRHEYYARKAREQHRKTITLNRRRGDILDRRGQVLATSTFFDSIYFDPKQMIGELPEEAAERIARVLGMPKARIERIFTRKSVTPVQRKVPPEVAQAMRVLEDDLRIAPGALFFVKESKRLYPKGALAGPVLGFTRTEKDGDNSGIEGLEKLFDSELNGRVSKQRILVNSWRQGLIPVDEEAVRATFGDHLVLTLDSQLQHFTEKALDRRVGEVQAKGGVAIVMEVKTGEILALASCPDFDPNYFSRARTSQLRNRALTDPFEIGSVMKIFTATILIDNGLLSTQELVDCENGSTVIDGRRITDSHPIGVVPFHQAFAESSNVAAAKLGLRIEPHLYYRSLKQFGLGSKLGIDLPGENSGLLRPVSQWSNLTRTSLPMGYETTMTALQVVTAVAAVGNGGVRMRPLIVQRIVSADGRTVREFPPVEVAHVASAETCRTIVDLMEEVVREGTGTQAQLAGYRIAAKTGTSKKHPKKRLYVASMAGLVPASKPRVAIFVYLDEPDPGIDFYGGRVAGPVFTEIAQHVVRVLGIPPDNPEEILIARAREQAGATRSEQTDAPRRAPVENLEGAPTQSDGGTPEARSEGMASWELTSMLGEAKARPAEEEQIVAGRMPDCRELTMTKVLERMTRARIEVRLLGTGLAVSQSPMPGKFVGEGAVAEVVFALTSERKRELVGAGWDSRLTQRRASALPDSR